MTLVEVLTYDNVDDTMRISMYGCKNYFEYHNPDMELFNSLCGADGGGLGWLAPIFFVIFIILCGFVMMSSLVGLTISSMEQLTDIRNAEIEIWKDVDEIAREYEITQESIDGSLKLFEAIDKEVKCHLTYRDLQPLLRSTGMTDEQEQLQYYLRVDRDGSGQIEFPEFVEFLAILGYSLGKTVLSRRKEEFEAAVTGASSESVDQMLEIPAALSVLALEQRSGYGSVIDPSVEGSVNVKASAKYKYNRNAVERKSFRARSKKVDNHRLVKSIYAEKSYSVHTFSYGEADKRNSHINGTDKVVGVMNKWEENPMDKYLEMPLEIETVEKPKVVIESNKKASNAIAVSSALVFIDEE